MGEPFDDLDERRRQAQREWEALRASRLQGLIETIKQKVVREQHLQTAEKTLEHLRAYAALARERGQTAEAERLVREQEKVRSEIPQRRQEWLRAAEEADKARQSFRAEIELIERRYGVSLNALPEDAGSVSPEEIRAAAAPAYPPHLPAPRKGDLNIAPISFNAADQGGEGVVLVRASDGCVCLGLSVERGADMEAPLTLAQAEAVIDALRQAVRTVKGRAAIAVGAIPAVEGTSP